jgi:transcriptional regulator with PAS, ATPase and Fis domain
VLNLGDHEGAFGAGHPACSGEPDAFDAILGTDPALLAAKRMAARFARTPLPVLLLAETGTGKELFARAIHAASPRHAAAFVALNCGALAPGLLESELFGHAPGAFTGAQRTGSLGKLAAADGGTLFLDEIAEMPEALQATLLRVLEDGSYYRVGEAHPRKSDFRLVCATCRDLPALVLSGRFRRDLFFRIQGACVTIPPVRERDDRFVLAQGLLASLAAEERIPCPELSTDAVAWLQAHPFPGNVRELKSALAHALVMSDGAPVIGAEHFPRVILRDTAPPAPAVSAPMSSGVGPASTGFGPVSTGFGPSSGGVAPASGGVGPVSAPLSGPVSAPVPSTRRRDDIVQEAMVAALRECDGNVSEAARRLGVARSTLYRRMPQRHR